MCFHKNRRLESKHVKLQKHSLSYHQSLLNYLSVASALFHYLTLLHANLNELFYQRPYLIQSDNFQMFGSLLCLLVQLNLALSANLDTFEIACSLQGYLCPQRNLQ